MHELHPLSSLAIDRLSAKKDLDEFSVFVNSQLLSSPSVRYDPMRNSHVLEDKGASREHVYEVFSSTAGNAHKRLSVGTIAVFSAQKNNHRPMDLVVGLVTKLPGKDDDLEQSTVS